MSDLKSLKVLVVDDDLVIIAMLLDFFRREGNECESARNGKEGFQKVLDGHFDLIVMDVQMPEMNGVDCVRAIRQVDPHVPILIISGDFPTLAVQALLEEKENAFLRKPFSPEDLMSAMGALLIRAGGA